MRGGVRMLVGVYWFGPGQLGGANWGRRFCTPSVGADAEFKECRTHCTGWVQGKLPVVCNDGWAALTRWRGGTSFRKSGECSDLRQ